MFAWFNNCINSQRETANYFKSNTKGVLGSKYRCDMSNVFTINIGLFKNLFLNSKQTQKHFIC